MIPATFQVWAQSIGRQSAWCEGAFVGRVESARSSRKRVFTLRLQVASSRGERWKRFKKSYGLHRSKLDMAICLPSDEWLHYTIRHASTVSTCKGGTTHDDEDQGVPGDSRRSGCQA